MRLAYTKKTKDAFGKKFAAMLTEHNRYLSGEGAIYKKKGAFITYFFPSDTKPLIKTNDEIINDFLSNIDLENHNIHAEIKFDKGKYFVTLTPVSPTGKGLH